MSLSLQKSDVKENERPELTELALGADGFLENDMATRNLPQIGQESDDFWVCEVIAFVYETGCCTIILYTRQTSLPNSYTVIGLSWGSAHVTLVSETCNIAYLHVEGALVPHLGIRPRLVGVHIFLTSTGHSLTRFETSESITSECLR